MEYINYMEYLKQKQRKPNIKDMHLNQSNRTSYQEKKRGKENQLKRSEQDGQRDQERDWNSIS